MLEFRDEDDFIEYNLAEKDRHIKHLENELAKYKSKAHFISQINTIVNRSAVNDDLYKTLFLYEVEIMDAINKSKEIPVSFIKEYMENLLNNVVIEIFIGEALYGELFGNNTQSQMHVDLYKLYNLSTTKTLDIEKILKEVELKNDFVEISKMKMRKMGLEEYNGGAVWVMEPLLGIVPGFIVFLLKGEQSYLTPIEKELISVFIKVLLPVIYSKILMKRVAEEAVQASKSALIDALTGMNNRKCLNEDYLDNPKVNSTDYVVMYMDLCKFKKINDTYGHDVADVVLVEVGKELSKLADAVGGKSYRIGGDEFVVLVPTTTTKDMIKIETLRFKEHWKSLDFKHSEGYFQSDVSIGVFNNDFSERTKADVVKEADKLMYRSKEDNENYTTAYNF